MAESFRPEEVSRQGESRGFKAISGGSGEERARAAKSGVSLGAPVFRSFALDSERRVAVLSLVDSYNARKAP
jgi:hypothetical protein